MARKSTMSLAVSACLLAFAMCALPRCTTFVDAVPAPIPREWHRFAPIESSWRVEVHLLRISGDDDPPDGYQVVTMKDAAPADKTSLIQKCYYEKGQTTHARRALRYHPSGRLAMKIDNVGEEQFSRCWHADGGYAGRLHWRDGKWLDGESVSPDGKVRHRLVQGNGELVTYGRNAENQVHRLYVKEANILEKHFRDGRLSRVRLNRDGRDLIADRGEECLYGEKGIWRRTSGQHANWQSWDDDHEYKRKRLAPPQPYEKARAAFIEGFAATFEGRGLSWKGIGIDFVRSGESWPAVNH